MVGWNPFGILLALESHRDPKDSGFVDHQVHPLRGRPYTNKQTKSSVLYLVLVMIKALYNQKKLILAEKIFCGEN